MNDSLVNTPTVSTAGLIAASQVTLGDIDAAPEWIELLPAGVFSGRDGRGPYRVSDPEAVIAATRALGLETGIPIDYDHATDLAAPQGRPAPAAGWINELAVRNGTIWGRVEWTHHGAAAVTTHEYRYISPVFEHNRDGDVVRLVRAALTNNPNLTLTAISARASRPGENAVKEADNARLSELARQLCGVLGIAECSTSNEIIDVVRTLSESGITDKSANRTEPRGWSQPNPIPSMPLLLISSQSRNFRKPLPN